MPDRVRWRAPAEVATRIESELSTARHSDDPWPALERAHLLSQPWAWTHTRVHFVMLRLAFRQRDRAEFVGQLIRLTVAGPGSMVGKYPSGNTGRTAMRLTETAPVPDDIEATLRPYQTPR